MDWRLRVVWGITCDSSLDHLQVGDANRLALGVLGVFVGILELFNDVALDSFLQGFNRLLLVEDLDAHFGGDLLDNLAEWALLHQEVGCGLELFDVAQRHSSTLETIFSLLDPGFGNGLVGLGGWSMNGGEHCAMRDSSFVDWRVLWSE